MSEAHFIQIQSRLKTIFKKIKNKFSRVYKKGYLLLVAGLTGISIIPLIILLAPSTDNDTSTYTQTAAPREYSCNNDAITNFDIPFARDLMKNNKNTDIYRDSMFQSQNDDNDAAINGITKSLISTTENITI